MPYKGSRSLSAFNEPGPISRHVTCTDCAREAHWYVHKKQGGIICISFLHWLVYSKYRMQMCVHLLPHLRRLSMKNWLCLLFSLQVKHHCGIFSVSQRLLGCPITDCSVRLNNRLFPTWLNFSQRDGKVRGCGQRKLVLTANLFQEPTNLKYSLVI